MTLFTPRYTYSKYLDRFLAKICGVNIMDIMSRVRAYSYLSAVLSNRQGDPFCRSCNSFQSSLAAVEDSLKLFETKNGAEIEKLPDNLSLLFYVTKSWISGLRRPERVVSQKGTGNCRLPVGVCFLKSSFRMLEQIESLENESRK